MKIFRLLLLLPFFLLACSDNDDESPDPMDPNNNPPTVTAELELTVEICSDNVCSATLPVPGAQIFMYLSPELREDGTDIAIQAATNSLGQFTSTTLTAPEYWIIVQMPQPDGRQKLDYIRTPFNAKTFHLMTFTQN